MAVPNTNTFTLQDVSNEVDPSKSNLSDLFLAAGRTGFVSAYEGSRDRLSNFRGYSRKKGNGNDYQIY
jgi:hypothetical protein